MTNGIAVPNSREVAATTPGISRNMQADAQAATPQGGGNLNGTQATSILFHQAGTNAGKTQVPRAHGGFSGNYTGTV